MDQLRSMRNTAIYTQVRNQGEAARTSPACQRQGIHRIPESRPDGDGDLVSVVCD